MAIPCRYKFRNNVNRLSAHNDLFFCRVGYTCFMNQEVWAQLSLICQAEYQLKTARWLIQTGPNYRVLEVQAEDKAAACLVKYRSCKHISM